MNQEDAKYDDPLKNLVGQTAFLKKESIQDKNNLDLRKHEIYDNTYYIHNNKIRLLEIRMNSSLTF
jgi:hypothetical protein